MKSLFSLYLLIGIYLILLISVYPISAYKDSSISEIPLYLYV